MSPDNPLISVALCTWNGARWLRPQLDSILSQEDVRIEVVALDDASSDDTLAILHEYTARDARIRVHANPENLGHLRSFEKCMAMCEGDFIAPADQDDIWLPRKLRTLLDAMDDADLAYCDSAYIDDQGMLSGRKISDDLTMHAGRDPLRYLFQNTVSGHAALLRREILSDAIPFPSMLFHDWWLAIRAAAGRGVVYVDQALVHFRRHGDACSALGKSQQGGARENRQARRIDRAATAKNRKWVSERAYVAEQYAAMPWREHERAADWARAFNAALAGERPALWFFAWRDRHSVPPWSGLPLWNAVQFYFRLKRKFRRARREGTPPAPIFRE